MSRKAARKHAFIMIYQMEFHEDLDLDEATQDYISELENISADDSDFIYTEIHGIKEHLNEIDSLISQYATGWSIERISKIDLAIMRLSIFEISHMHDIPVGVSINEAVELAKIYGDDESSSYVNGVLGKVSSVLAK